MASYHPSVRTTTNAADENHVTATAGKEREPLKVDQEAKRKLTPRKNGLEEDKNGGDYYLQTW